MRTQKIIYLAFIARCVLFTITSQPLVANALKSEDTDGPIKSLETRTLERFRGQLEAWQVSAGIYDDVIFKFDRRFKVQSCENAYIFQAVDASKNLIRASCDKPLWSRVLRAGKLASSGLVAKQTQRVWVSRSIIPAKEALNELMFEVVEIDQRKAPKNAIINAPGKHAIAKSAIQAGKILVSDDFFVPTTGLVAKVSIPAGTLIRPDMIGPQIVRQSFKGDLIQDSAVVRFMASNRTILAGDPIRRQDLRKAKLVRRGDQVKVISSGDNFMVTAKATALQDGYLNEQIRVESKENGRVIRVSVSDINVAIALN